MLRCCSLLVHATCPLGTLPLTCLTTTPALLRTLFLLRGAVFMRLRPTTADTHRPLPSGGDPLVHRHLAYPCASPPPSSFTMNRERTWWSGGFPLGSRVRVSSRSGSWVVGYIPRHATDDVASFACCLLPNRVLVWVPPGVVRMFRAMRMSFVPLLPERRVRRHIRAPAWSSSSSSASTECVEAWSQPSAAVGVEGSADDASDALPRTAREGAGARVCDL